jgi:hypothetical protein
MKIKAVGYNLPIFTAQQRGDYARSQKTGSDFPVTILFELGKCVTVPFSAGIKLVSFSG